MAPSAVIIYIEIYFYVVFDSHFTSYVRIKREIHRRFEFNADVTKALITLSQTYFRWLIVYLISGLKWGF